MKKILKFFHVRDKSNYATIESFELLYNGWRRTANIPDKFNGLSNIFHFVFCWACLLMCPVAFIVGSLKALKYLPFMAVLSSIQASINVITLPIKAIIIAIYAKRLKSVEPFFTSLDQRYRRQMEYRKIKDCIVTCRRIFITYYIMYWLYGCLMCIVAILKNKLPVGLWLPFFDFIPYSNIRYYISFLFEIFYTLFLLQCQINNDSYSAIYMRAIRTHVNLLTERVLRLGMKPESSEEENFKELIDCIKSHKELLEISRNVGVVVSLTIFAQFTVAAIILCVCMLNILVFADRTYQVVTVIYYLCVVLQTVPTCYEASMLEADSAKLPLAIFHCNWLALDKNSRKLIPYFMQRAQQGISFSAIKLFQINLKTNLSIAKFSFTLYTFITELGIGEKIKERFQ